MKKFLKNILFKILGESIPVQIVALPFDDLNYKFLAKIGKNGVWNLHKVTIASTMCNRGHDVSSKPLEIFKERYLNDGKHYHFKVLKNKKKIKKIASKLLEEVNTEFL